jgi:hypothetical protein
MVRNALEQSALPVAMGVKECLRSTRWGSITMAISDSPHDKLFKAAFEDVKDAAAELRSVLPGALVARLELGTLAPVPGSFVDEALHGSQSDLLYTVRHGAQEALLYVLCEHKSEVDKWTVLQLLRYMVRIWEQVLAQKPAPTKLPPIIPVIVHHSETGWTAPTTFQGLFDAQTLGDAELKRLTPEFAVLIDDISYRSDEELRLRALGAGALLGLLFLRDGRREGQVLAELEDWADLFRALLGTPNGRRAILQLFSYLISVAPNLSLPQLEQRVQQAIPETEELVMTLAEQLKQQGREEGLSQGLSQGLARQRGLVRRLVELKFGTMTADTLSRLDGADESALERYAERTITATSLAEVLSD